MSPEKEWFIDKFDRMIHDFFQMLTYTIKLDH